MADPKFKEAEPNHGVDDDAVPIPEMIVPLKGTNQILLINGDGLDVKAEKPGVLEITEVKGFVKKGLPTPHMWQLRGKMSGKDGLLVYARKGTKETARLRVYVLDNRVVRLAVRPLQTIQGAHATKVPDIDKFVKKMNEIWGPQANLKIDLVSSKTALIDGTPDQIAREIGAFKVDPVTKERTPDEEKGVFKEYVSLETFKDAKRDYTSFEPVFNSYLERDSVRNTDFTLIVVHAIFSQRGKTFGETASNLKFALVSEDASARQWAHELGHHLGGGHKGTAEHMLMTTGEEWEKIPVQDAVNVFNKPNS